MPMLTHSYARLVMAGAAILGGLVHAQEAFVAPTLRCQVLDGDALPGEDTEWDGRCEAGLVEGRGTLISKVGVTIVKAQVGVWRSGYAEGPGILTRGDGVVVRGSWRHGILDGPVVITYADGAPLFEGEWLAGAAQGHGTYHYLDGSVYVGDFAAGKRSGRGTLTQSSGDLYDGDWVDDEGNGQVFERRADGSTYNGQWRSGLRHGHGTRRDLNGKVYEGAFCFDLPCPAGAQPKDKFGIPLPP